MYTHRIHGHLTTIKGRLKEQWGRLTHDRQLGAMAGYQNSANTCLFPCRPRTPAEGAGTGDWTPVHRTRTRRSTSALRQTRGCIQ